MNNQKDPNPISNHNTRNIINMNFKYNAIDIANYIINRVNNDTTSYDNLNKLRLQKMTYYLLIAYLDEYDELLFDITHDDRIEKWMYGSNIRSLYRLLARKYTMFHISQPLEYVCLYKNNNNEAIITEGNDSNDLSFNNTTERLFNHVIDTLMEIPLSVIVEYNRREYAWFKHELDILQNGIRHYQYTLSDLRESITQYKQLMRYGESL